MTISRIRNATKRRLLEPIDNAFTAPFFGAVISVRTSRPYVALTFDDGPEPNSTPAVLDILARHAALGTFFCLGSAATRYKEMVLRIAAAGHAIGSHTSTHPSLPRLSRSQVAREIAEGHAALGEIAVPLFRPPYGHYGIKVARSAKSLGLTPVLWNGHADDWLSLDSDEIAQKLTLTLQPGAIVLLHDALNTYGQDGVPDRAAMLVALDKVLSSHKDAYRFVTVPQLLTAGRAAKSMAARHGPQ